MIKFACSVDRFIRSIGKLFKKQKDIEEMTMAEVFEEAKKEITFLPPIPFLRNAIGDMFLGLLTVF